jgi:hypothetical protein
MGLHGHHEHGGSLVPYRKPSKAIKAVVVPALRAASGDRERAMQAIAPLQLDSPVLFEQCGKLIDAGNVARALMLIEQAPTRISGGVLTLLIVGPVALAGIIVAVVLALTLGR